MNMIRPSDPSAEITVVNRHLQYPKVTLQPPTSSGYIHIAAEIDRIWPFGLGPTSAAKRAAKQAALSFTRALKGRTDVIGADVLVAAFIPPGHGALQLRRPDIHVARFDLVVLIETMTPDAAAALLASGECRSFVTLLEEKAPYVHVVRARNARRIGDVDKSRDGVFLCNFFHGDQSEKLVPVWEYTAGWFQKTTGLDNSVLLMPEPGETSQYGIINHCRWDGWMNILPHLRFRPTFRSYVLANFEANGIVPMPILYRLAK